MAKKIPDKQPIKNVISWNYELKHRKNERVWCQNWRKIINLWSFQHRPTILFGRFFSTCAVSVHFRCLKDTSEYHSSISVLQTRQAISQGGFSEIISHMEKKNANFAIDRESFLKDRIKLRFFLKTCFFLLYAIVQGKIYIFDS
jgi:hypothetical protein